MPRRRGLRKWALLALAAVLLAGFLTPYLIGMTFPSQAALIPESVQRFSVWSPAFPSGSTMPSNYTCSGADESPPLEWSGEPNGTEYYAVLIVDLNSSPPGFVHWLLYNLPGNVTGLPAGVPRYGLVLLGSSEYAEQGTNGYGYVGYAGPCPPGGQVHEYEVIVYALGGPLSLQPGANEKEFLKALSEVPGIVKGVATMTFYAS